eukprot:gene7108-9700_t
MEEKTGLLKKSPSLLNTNVQDSPRPWGGTPGLRKIWVRSQSQSASTHKSIPNDTGITNNEPINHEKPIREFDEENLKEFFSVNNSYNSIGSTQSLSTYNTQINSSTTISNASFQEISLFFKSIKDECSFMNTFISTPGLLIAITLNLFLSMSFGQAFFPSTLIFPTDVSRGALGVQMFLFSSGICQIFLTTMSEFPTAMGMMMVENIPFMHIIANIVSSKPGLSTEAIFSTIIVTFGVSSIIVGTCFYLLGKLNIGNMVYFFPKHVIIGCIGGIGIFITQTGFEVATNKTWEWTLKSIIAFGQPNISSKLFSALAFEILLRIILFIYKMPLFPPFYFVSVPFIFYFIIFLMGVSVNQAHLDGWFFEDTTDADAHSDPWKMFELMNIFIVDWASVGECLPTIIALTIFSLMHVPINIPSLSISTGRSVNMNQELMAHGYSNIVAGLFGGLQNYLCYSNSLLYFKCGGGGKISGYLLTMMTVGAFYAGPQVVRFMPRVMPGCLLMHIGLDLTKEALWDSYGAFDAIEYGSVLGITVVMTAYGMTAGLALGVICAAFTFTLQASRHVHIIRGKMCARTLRSSRRRNAREYDLLNLLTRHITIVQLQGNVFFGNATILAEEVEAIVRVNSLRSSSQPSSRQASFREKTANGSAHGSHSTKSNEKNSSSQETSHEVWFLVLDFTLVVGIDSSAADTIAKIFDICHKYNVKLCFSRGSRQGFPCEIPLTDRLIQIAEQNSSDHNMHEAIDAIICSLCGSAYCLQTFRCLQCNDNKDFKAVGLHQQNNEKLSSYNKQLFVSDTLDEALAWCEDQLILKGMPILDPFALLHESQNDSFSSESSLPIPSHIQQIFDLSKETSSQPVIELLSYFHNECYSRGDVLWRQGDESNRAVLIISGKLTSVLEEEVGTTEEILPGHLVGEFGLINNRRRLTALVVEEDVELLVIGRSMYDKMIDEQPKLALLFSKICMGYLEHRVMHVANRIWESHCIPV